MNKSKMGFSHQRTFFLLLFLLTLFTLGTADDVRFQLDTVADKGEDWDFLDGWFVYGHNVSMLESRISKKQYPVPDTFKNSFKTKALGIWGLFHHMKEMPRPSTSFTFTSISTAFDRVSITYFMYGSKAYINVTNPGDHTELIAKPITSDCFSKDCIKGFKTETLILKKCKGQHDCSGTGVVNKRYYGFTVSLNATHTDSFVLIDKITPIPAKPPVEETKMAANSLGYRLIKGDLLTADEETEKPNQNSICLSFVWIFLVVGVSIFAVLISLIMLCKIVSFGRLKTLMKKLRHILCGAPDGSDDSETRHDDGDGGADTKLIRDFPSPNI